MKIRRSIYSVILLMLLAIISAYPGYAQEKRTLAILDFDGLGISQQEAQLLTNRLRTLLVQTDSYRVIERGQMEQILQEQNFQLSLCTSQECAVEVGQLLGAQEIMTGSIGKIGQTFTVDLRIVDVETSSILKTASYDIRGEIDQMLTEGMVEVARRVSENSALGAGSKYGTLNVYSQPEGARVLVDGEEMGVTPFAATELSAGEEHTIQMMLDGYESYTESIVIDEGENPAINIGLEPIWNSVAIETKPRKANVQINDEVVGKTPVDQLQYPVGQYTIEVKKAGYKPYTSQFRVKPNEPTLLNIQLRSKSKGTGFLLSMVIPGAGHFYRGKTVGGVLFLGGTIVAGVMAADAHSQYSEAYDRYESLLDEYNRESDTVRANTLRDEVWQSFDEAKSFEKSRDAALGILGGIYSLNLLTVVF